jgi:hypothetical protein
MDNQETGKRITQAEFDEFLRAVVEAIGGVSAFSKRTTVDKSNLSKIVRGRKKPQPLLLKALKISEERTYILPPHWVKWAEENRLLSRAAAKPAGNP